MSLCTKNPKSYHELAEIPVPDSYGIYRPVKYTDHIDIVKDEYYKRLGLECTNEAYGTNKDGTQMFGVLDFTLDENGAYTYSHVLRGSYNKSISNQGGGGGKVFVCDNMMLMAECMMTARKNTIRAYEDLRYLVREVVANAGKSYDKLQYDVRSMQAAPCSLHEGYHILGEAIGTKVITPTVANVAFRDWNKPRHTEFSEQTIWSLYNGVTEGLKNVAAHNRMRQQTGAHEFFASLA